MSSPALQGKGGCFPRKESPPLPAPGGLCLSVSPYGGERRRRDREEQAARVREERGVGFSWMCSTTSISIFSLVQCNDNIHVAPKFEKKKKARSASYTICVKLKQGTSVTIAFF
jgi:hypothetical protein